MNHENLYKLIEFTAAIKTNKNTVTKSINDLVQNFDKSQFQNINIEQIKELDSFIDGMKDPELDKSYENLTNNFFEIISEQQNYRLDDETKEYFQNRYAKILEKTIKLQKNDGYRDDPDFFPNMETISNATIANDYKHFNGIELNRYLRVYAKIYNICIEHFLKEIRNPDNTYDHERIKKYAKSIYGLLDAERAIRGPWRDMDREIYLEINETNLINKKPFDLYETSRYFLPDHSKDDEAAKFLNILINNFDKLQFENLTTEQIERFDTTIAERNNPEIQKYREDLINKFFETYSKQQKYRLNNETKESFKNIYAKILEKTIELQKNENNIDKPGYYPNDLTIANAMISNDYQKFENIDEAGSMSRYNAVLEKIIAYFIKENTTSSNRYNHERAKRYKGNICEILKLHVGLRRRLKPLDEEAYKILSIDPFSAFSPH